MSTPAVLRTFCIDTAGSIGRFVLLVLSAVLFVGCSLERSYEVRGRVVGFGDDPRTVIVEHEDIPGLMPAMTMPFQALDAAAVQALDVGDAVAFTLHVAPDSSWISDVAALPDDAVDRHPAGSDTRPTTVGGGTLLNVGDPVPDVTLVSQAGDTLRTGDYAGRSWLITFIYTRCPLPDYCPLMSQRFQQLQPRLAEQYGDRVALLSVTFDPAYDTPQVLAEYADRYGADPARWTFATGDPSEIAHLAHRFGVFYETNGNVIDHNLTTALVGPDGTVRALWRGNDWTPEDVVQALRTAVP